MVRSPNPYAELDLAEQRRYLPEAYGIDYDDWHRETQVESAIGSSSAAPPIRPYLAGMGPAPDFQLKSSSRSEWTTKIEEDRSIDLEHWIEAIESRFEGEAFTVIKIDGTQFVVPALDAERPLLQRYCKQLRFPR